MPTVILSDGQSQQIPNVLILHLAISSFFWVKMAGFSKNCGVSACVNVVLHSMGRTGDHITHSEYRGKFLTQKFDICKHRVWNRLGWSWLSGGQNRKWWVYHGLVALTISLKQLHL
jgi:hypothetical protein